MRVLVACEYSGRVRDAFLAAGHDAMSCDLLPTDVPWMFGHPEKKATGLWLKGLPPLLPTEDVRDLMAGLPKSQTDRIHYASPGPDRWKLRSTTYSGIAKAMAHQWGGVLSEAAA